MNTTQLRWDCCEWLVTRACALMASAPGWSLRSQFKWWLARGLTSIAKKVVRI